MAYPRNLTDAAYQTLRHAVMTGVLLPGTHLSEAMLCERYHLTLAPARTAMARLRAEGLLMARRRAGHLVTPITVADVLDIFATRRLLQAFAVEQAAGRVPSAVDGEALRRLDAACLDAIGKNEAYLAANHTFHQAVVDAAGSPRISAIVAQLLEHSMRVQHVMLNLTHARPLPSWRPELIAALQAGEAETARVVMLRHLDAVRARALELLVTNPALHRVPLAGRPPPPQPATPSEAAAALAAATRW